MDDYIPVIGSKVTRSWIKPPTRFAPTTLEALVAQFRAVSRIAETWLVGSRITPRDGTPAYESTSIALVVDPPFVGDAEAEAMVELIAQLDDASPITEGRRSWLFVSDAIIRARQEQATLLYARSVR